MLTCPASKLFGKKIIMFSALKTTNAKFGAVVLVCLILSQPALAQVSANGETPFSRSQTPSLNTSVTNGQIVVRQPGQNPVAGQFGFTPSSNAPTMAVPNSSGPQFQPPTLGSGLNGQQSPSASTATSLNLEVDGPNEFGLARVAQAKIAAVNACSSGTQAACDVALRTLVSSLRALYSNATSTVLTGNILTSFQEVVASVRASTGAASNRALNIATIDAVFSQYAPDRTASRPSSPS